jgi:hypothetical protein
VARGLGASEQIPPRTSTEDAWYRAVCVRLQEVANRKGQPLWIAIDDLGVGQDGAPLLDAEIRKFCDQLVLNMPNPAFRRWFRVMLINYPSGPVPTRWRSDHWDEDRTSEADLRQEHVAQLLRVWAERRGHSILEGDLTKLATEVISRAEDPSGEGSKQRLQRIHDALKETLRGLAGVAS